MSEKLPGAEFAPVEVILLVDGRRTTVTDRDLASLGENMMWADLSWPHGRMVRRLSCTDPDDQRAVWRLAALAFGYGADVAQTAILSLRSMPDYPEVIDWMLCVHAGTDEEEYLWGAPDDVSSVEEATAALCARVWGPK